MIGLNNPRWPPEPGLMPRQTGFLPPKPRISTTLLRFEIMKNFIIGLFIGIVATACYFRYLYSSEGKPIQPQNSAATQVYDSTTKSETIQKPASIVIPQRVVLSGTQVINRDSLLSFAKTLIGTPYLYASADPAKGFDCSGFITYAFNHFNMAVPRSSYEFENVGKEVTLSSCQKGDLILFTGTNPQERTIGHIGIVIDAPGGQPSFIHSSSGKANGVTITSMESPYYQERFVRVVDVISR